MEEKKEEFDQKDLLDETEPFKLPEPPEEEMDEEDSVVVTKITTEELSDAIKNKNKARLNEIFETVPDIDIAEAADGLEMPELIRFFRENNSSLTAIIFDELSQDTKEDLIRAMTDKDLVRLINEQYADDLADTIVDMPANLANRVLKAADKDMREDLNQLLQYKPDTAGAIMTTEYLEFKEDMSVKQAIANIRSKGKDAETVYTIFVRDKMRKFVGTVDLDDLIFADEDEILSAIMNTDAPSCHVNTDKEEVANLFRRYDLNAIAVLNDDDCLTGIVTIDDAVDVLIEEAGEDIEKMNAMSALEDSYMETKTMQMAKKCVPWIIALLILGTFSSLVLSNFQDKIAQYSILSAFIPVLMDTGGNAGGQTIALVIRGLALKEFTPKHFGQILWKEFKSACIIALFVALFAFFWFTIEQYTGIVTNPNIPGMNGAIGTIWNGQCWNMEFFIETIKVSAIVSITLFVTTVVSKIIAVSLPIGAAAIKKDPAILSQPLLTTFIDVSSLLLYFGIAELLILNPPF